VYADKQLAICVTFAYGALETKFDVLDIFSCPDSNADGIFGKLSQCLQALEKEGVDLRIWVGFCADTTCSVMGCCHSLSTLTKTIYLRVVAVKCSCHLAHLCAQYACKKLPKGLEDFC